MSRQKYIYTLKLYILWLFYIIKLPILYLILSEEQETPWT